MVQHMIVFDGNCCFPAVAFSLLSIASIIMELKSTKVQNPRCIPHMTPLMHVMILVTLRGIVVLCAQFSLLHGIGMTRSGSATRSLHNQTASWLCSVSV